MGPTLRPLSLGNSQVMRTLGFYIENCCLSKFKGPNTNIMRTLGVYIGNFTYSGFGEMLLVLVLGHCKFASGQHRLRDECLGRQPSAIPQGPGTLSLRNQGLKTLFIMVFGA